MWTWVSVLPNFAKMDSTMTKMAHQIKATKIPSKDRGQSLSRCARVNQTIFVKTKETTTHACQSST